MKERTVMLIHPICPVTPSTTSLRLTLQGSSYHLRFVSKFILRLTWTHPPPAYARATGSGYHLRCRVRGSAGACAAAELAGAGAPGVCTAGGRQREEAAVGRAAGRQGPHAASHRKVVAGGLQSRLARAAHIAAQAVSLSSGRCISLLSFEWM
jgi:hypothetical protein